MKTDKPDRPDLLWQYCYSVGYPSGIVLYSKREDVAHQVLLYDIFVEYGNTYTPTRLVYFTPKSQPHPPTENTSVMVRLILADHPDNIGKYLDHPYSEGLVPHPSFDGVASYWGDPSPIDETLDHQRRMVLAKVVVRNMLRYPTFSEDVPERWVDPKGD